MAVIISCPECGEKISDEAVFCPYCGCTSIQKKRAQNIGIGAIMIAVVGFLAFCTFAPQPLVAIVAPLVMVVIGLLVKSKVWKGIFIFWAILTFFANI